MTITVLWALEDSPTSRGGVLYFDDGQTLPRNGPMLRSDAVTVTSRDDSICTRLTIDAQSSKIAWHYRRNRAAFHWRFTSRNIQHRFLCISETCLRRLSHTAWQHSWGLNVNCSIRLDSGNERNGGLCFKKIGYRSRVSHQYPFYLSKRTRQWNRF